MACALLTFRRFSSHKLGVLLLVSWPAYFAAHWLPWRHMPRPAVVPLVFVLLLTYYAFLHVGLFLALWKWKAKWLWLEVAMVVFVAAVEPLAVWVL